jgi:hypothetical protein
MRLKQMRELPFVVECKSSLPFYEPIAAFNVECIARDYAGDCAKVNPHFSYRVVQHHEER